MNKLKNKTPNKNNESSAQPEKTSKVSGSPPKPKVKSSLKERKNKVQNKEPNVIFIANPRNGNLSIALLIGIALMRLSEYGIIYIKCPDAYIHRSISAQFIVDLEGYLRKVGAFVYVSEGEIIRDGRFQTHIVTMRLASYTPPNMTIKESEGETGNE